jgi:hypothetical protein
MQIQNRYDELNDDQVQYIENAAYMFDDMYRMLEDVKVCYSNLIEFSVLPSQYKTGINELIERIEKLLAKARGE